MAKGPRNCVLWRSLLRTRICKCDVHSILSMYFPLRVYSDFCHLQSRTDQSRVLDYFKPDTDSAKQESLTRAIMRIKPYEEIVNLYVGKRL